MAVLFVLTAAGILVNLVGLLAVLQLPASMLLPTSVAVLFVFAGAGILVIVGRTAGGFSVAKRLCYYLRLWRFCSPLLACWHSCYYWLHCWRCCRCRLLCYCLLPLHVAAIIFVHDGVRCATFLNQRFLVKLLRTTSPDRGCLTSWTSWT
jgi:hypothetical protein